MRRKTISARASVPRGGTVHTLAGLRGSGWTDSAVDAQLRARRWQRFGNVVLLHNAAPSAFERQGIALLNCGPHAVLTAFSAAQQIGLQGWEPRITHVLVPGGTHVVRVPEAPVRLHYAGDWRAVRKVRGRRLHMIGPALVRAAATFATARPACGILAAAVQQELVTADGLGGALAAATRTRHRAVLIAATHDIAQGAQALSEIDFGRLCRRHRLPAPTRQAVRVEPDGRRRYLDAEWTRRDGKRVVAEVDGALHLAPRRWWDDQLRQNELVIGGDLVLRFPSAVVRTEAPVVADQLRRMLGL